MTNKDLERYGDLPEPLYVIERPVNEGAEAQLYQKLHHKLSELITQAGVCGENQLESVSFLEACLLTEILLYGRVDIRNFVHKIQKNIGPLDQPLRQETFKAAWRVVYDWCATGGKNAATIGEGLN